MKKILVLILMMVMLAGCGVSREVPPSLMGDVYSDISGVEIRVERVLTQAGVTKLEVVWRNNTGYEVTYGEPYGIQRLEDDAWVDCSREEHNAFITVGYSLKPGEETRKTYDVSQLFDVSRQGTYRFNTSCSVYELGKERQECKLWAEFEIAQEPTVCPPPDAATEVAWCARYIRTDGASEAVTYPGVRILRSLQELRDYYNMWQEVFDLERRETVYSDTSIGFLDACDAYDEAFFEENYLMLVLLEEGSGSIRHEVQSVTQTPEKKLDISIDRKVPQEGTDDMAQWHIILELSRQNMVEDFTDVTVYVDGKAYTMEAEEVHCHMTALQPQTVADPIDGYCGNIQSTLYIGGETYTFMYGNSVTLTDILANLDYDPNKVCRCMPQYRADTEFGTNYHIHLDYGFVRCDKGQAELTVEQVNTIAEIIRWAESTGCEYPID